jgi:hypothetical protein
MLQKWLEWPREPQIFEILFRIEKIFNSTKTQRNGSRDPKNWFTLPIGSIWRAVSTFHHLFFTPEHRFPVNFASSPQKTMSLVKMSAPAVCEQRTFDSAVGRWSDFLVVLELEREI